MLWTWVGRESCLWKLYSDFKTWKYTVIFFAKHCDINFQTCEKIIPIPHMHHHTYANSPTKLPKRNRSLSTQGRMCQEGCAAIACYRLLVSGWAARCKIVFFMPNLWKWVNRRTGTSRRSSHTFVATDSSGTGPLERTAERLPLQSVVMRKVPLFTPFQVQLATRLGVTTALRSYAFRALDICPSFVGAITGIKLNNIYYSHSTMSTHTHSVM